MNQQGRAVGRHRTEPPSTNARKQRRRVILVAGVAAAALLVAVVAFVLFVNGQPARVQSALEDTLRNAAAATEEYHAMYREYPQDSALLSQFAPEFATEVSVFIRSVTDSDYCLEAIHRNGTAMHLAGRTGTLAFGRCP